MLVTATGDGRKEAVALLFVGGLGLLAGVIGAVRSSLSEGDASPGRRALVHWLPVAVAALVAAGLNHSEMAVGMALGTSIAALSAVTGFIALAGTAEEVPARAQRVWPFLPVPALLVFLVGFRGSIGVFEASALALQGVLVLLVWLEPRPDELAGSGAWQPPVIPYARKADAPGLTDVAVHRPIARSRAALSWRAAQLVLALCIAAVGGWAVARGAEHLTAVDSRYSPSVLAATLLSVAMVMPMVSSGVPLAAGGRAWAPITAHAGLAFLNMGVLLPAIAAAPALRAAVLRLAGAAPAAWEPILYPRIAWRVDSVVLLIVTLVYVPAAVGRLRFGWALGLALIGGYCVYLMSAMVIGGMMG